MKWQYLVLNFRTNTDMHAALNDYGIDGWELVAVTHDDGISTVFLKRESSANQLPKE